MGVVRRTQTWLHVMAVVHPTFSTENEKAWATRHGPTRQPGELSLRLGPTA